tara:strand:+ start:49 stop:564 length:516 start_codon:yes stop_codon:yes gene_type:complete
MDYKKLYEKSLKERVADEKTIAQLKEENEKLKQFALGVHNFVWGTKYDDEDIVSSMDFDAIIDEMKKDEEKLKEIAEQAYDEDTGELATEVLYQVRCETRALEKDYCVLEEENEKLVEKNAEYERQITSMVDYMTGNWKNFRTIEECITGRYTQEFIDANKEAFNRYGLFE